MEQAVANERQVVVGLLRGLCQKQIPAQPVHQRVVAPPAAVRMQPRGHALAESLCHVGMPARPEQDAPQQAEGPCRVVCQSTRQRPGLLGREVAQLDAPPDVEGAEPGVAHQVRGRGHPQQAESQPGERRVTGSAVVALPDAPEELVGREWQAAHGVDLVDEQHQVGHGVLPRRGRQQHVAEGLDEALHRPQLAVLLPEGQQLGRPPRLLARAGQQAAVPLLGGQVLPQRRQVQHGHAAAFFSEPPGRPHHQAGLAHLPGVQDVAELAPAQRAQQFGVCATLHVGWGVQGQRAARDIEIDGDREIVGTVRVGRLLRIVWVIAHAAGILPDVT